MITGDATKTSAPFSLLIRIGLLTGGAIILFRMIGLLVIYRHLKMDYYLCVVALCFLLIGLLLNRRQQPNTQPAANILAILTSKEIHILRMLAEGMTNQEIASAQFIALSTVKTHVNNIYSKLSVSNRKEARAKYAELARLYPIS
jgi:DNA-binding CsgD family transcriptional regulator